MDNSKAIREIRAFNRFYTNAIGVVDRHILNSPYSLTEVRIMYEIYHDVRATARTIRRYLQVDEGYLSRTIDNLVNQGLIVRRRSGEDRRAFDLSLTGKGKREFLLLNGRSEQAVDSMIAALSAREVGTLVSAMSVIRRLLSKEENSEGNAQGHRNQKRTRAR